MSEISFSIRVELPNPSLAERLLHALSNTWSPDPAESQAGLRELGELAELPRAFSDSVAGVFNFDVELDDTVVVMHGALGPYDAFDILAEYLEGIGASSMFALLNYESVGESEFRAMGSRGLLPVHGTGKNPTLDDLFYRRDSALERGRLAYLAGAFGDHASKPSPTPLVHPSRPVPGVDQERRHLQRLRIQEGRKAFRYIDLDGRLVGEQSFATASDFVEGRAFAATEPHGDFSLLAPDGAVLRGGIHTPTLYVDGLAAVLVTREGSGMLDRGGELVRRFPPDVRITSDVRSEDNVHGWQTHANERVAALSLSTRLRGWVDLDGNWICEPRYSRVGRFSEGRAAFERTEGSEGRAVFGWVDTRGDEVAVMADGSGLPSPFSGGISTAHSPFRAFDRTGQLVFSSAHYRVRRPFSCGLAVVHDSASNQVLTIGVDGQPIACGFERMQDHFVCGLAAARHALRWGLCNPEGDFWPLPAKLRARAWITATQVAGVVEVRSDDNFSDSFLDLSGREIWSASAEATKSGA